MVWSNSVSILIPALIENSNLRALTAECVCDQSTKYSGHNGLGSRWGSKNAAAADMGQRTGAHTQQCNCGTCLQRLRFPVAILLHAYTWRMTHCCCCWCAKNMGACHRLKHSVLFFNVLLLCDILQSFLLGRSLSWFSSSFWGLNTWNWSKMHSFPQLGTNIRFWISHHCFCCPFAWPDLFTFRFDFWHIPFLLFLLQYRVLDHLFIVICPWV